MRTANLAGRLVLLTDSGAVDVEQASHGRFAADPQAVYRRWDEFVGWAVSRIEGIGEMRHRLVAARLEGALAGTSGGGNER